MTSSEVVAIRFSFLHKTIYFLICSFFFIIGLGRINLKPYGIPISFGGNIFPVIIVVLLLCLISHIKKPNFLLNELKSNIIPLFLSLALTLSSWFHFAASPLGDESAKIQFKAFLLCFLIYTIPILLPQNTSKIKLLKKVILWSVLGACVSVIRGLLHPFFTEDLFTLYGSNTLRIYSPIGHPNFYGTYLVLILPLTFIVEYKTKYKNLIYIGLFLLLIGIFMTYSRSSWLALCVCFFSLCIGYKSQIKESLSLQFKFFKNSLSLIIFIVIILGIFLIFKNDSAVKQRLQSSFNLSQDSNIQERLFHFQASLLLIKGKSTIKGIGFGTENFKRSIDPYRNQGSVERLPHAHNQFIQIGVTMGVISLLLFILCIIYPFFSSINANTHKSIVISIFASITAFVVCSFFDTSLVSDRVSPIVGLILSAHLYLLNNSKVR